MGSPTSSTYQDIQNVGQESQSFNRREEGYWHGILRLQSAPAAHRPTRQQSGPSHHHLHLLISVFPLALFDNQGYPRVTIKSVLLRVMEKMNVAVSTALQPPSSSIL